MLESRMTGNPPYRIEPPNRCFEANRRMAEHELRPGNTVSLVTEVDLSEVEELRRAGGTQRPSYTAFVVKAIALALREHPYANRRVVRCWWRLWGRTTLQRFENIDVAVAAEREIPGAEACAFVDVARGADRSSLTDLTHWLRGLAHATEDTNEQWRTFKRLVERLPCWMTEQLVRLPVHLPGAWVRYRGAAAIVSSPAKYGVDMLVTTWPWPLGFSFGLVKERPFVVAGRLEVRPTTHLMLNFDRRVMAGAQGARFFAKVVENLTHARSVLSDSTPLRLSDVA